MTRPLLKIFTLALIVASVGMARAFGQVPSKSPTGQPTLGLEQGLAEFDMADFSVKLVKASQTLAALEPKSAAGFDFTPADRLNVRAANGFYHRGDIIFT